MENKIKKPWYKKWWVITIGIILFLIIISGNGDKDENTTATTSPEVTQSSNVQTENQAVKSNVSASTTPSTAKTYQQVFTFSGNGAKKSEPFTITGDRFKIKYDCDGDLCQAFLYKVPERMTDIIMNSSGPVNDETIIYGKGEYYIDSNSLGSYKMIVEDYK